MRLKKWQDIEVKPKKDFCFVNKFETEKQLDEVSEIWLLN